MARSTARSLPTFARARPVACGAHQQMGAARFQDVFPSCVRWATLVVAVASTPTPAHYAREPGAGNAIKHPRMVRVQDTYHGYLLRT